jgi:hypothetical protein
MPIEKFAIRASDESALETTAIGATIEGSCYIGISSVPHLPTFFVKSLPADCFFNVLRFGGSFEPIFGESVPYSAPNVAKALYAIPIMAADLGTTSLLSPLTFIFGQAIRPGYGQQIFVLTDGAGENSLHIIAQSRMYRHNHGIFSAGIGESVDRQFVEDLAHEAGGTALFVKSSGDEALFATMEQLKGALRPAVTDLQVHVSEGDDIEISPFPLPTIFDASLQQIFARLPARDEETAVRVSAVSGEVTIELNAAVTFVEPGMCLDKFFGYYNLRDLEEKLVLAPEHDSPRLREMLVSASKQWGLRSRLTALGWSAAPASGAAKRSRPPAKGLGQSRPSARHNAMSRTVGRRGGQPVSHAVAWGSTLSAEEASCRRTMLIQLGQEKSRASFNVHAVISAQAFERLWGDGVALNGPRIKWSRGWNIERF